MDLDEMHILAACAVLLYEDHLRSNGHIKTAVELARAMRMLKESVPTDTMEMCQEFKCQVPAKAVR